MSVSDQQVKQQFWSIERFVSFVLAPVVTPLSGALALWLGKHFPGVHVTGDAIYAFAATTSAGVAGSFIKWLDGRSKFVAQTATIEGRVGQFATPLLSAIPPAERASLLADLKNMLASEEAKVTAALPGGSKPEASAQGTDPWATPNDPAPETPTPVVVQEPPAQPSPGQAPAPAQPSAVDQGAAVTGA